MHTIQKVYEPHPPKKLPANFCVHLFFSGEGSIEFLRFLKGFMTEMEEEPMSHGLGFILEK